MTALGAWCLKAMLWVGLVGGLLLVGMTIGAVMSYAARRREANERRERVRRAQAWRESIRRPPEMPDGVDDRGRLYQNESER